MDGSTDYFIYIVKYNYESRLFGTVLIEKFFRFRSLLGEFLGYPFPERLHVTFRGSDSNGKKHFTLSSDTDWKLLHSEASKGSDAVTRIAKKSQPGAFFYMLPISVVTILPPDVDPNPSLKYKYYQLFKLRLPGSVDYLAIKVEFTNLADLTQQLSAHLKAAAASDVLTVSAGKKKKEKGAPKDAKTLTILEKARICAPPSFDSRTVKKGADEEDLTPLNISNNRELAHYILLHRARIQSSLDMGLFVDPFEPILVVLN